MRRSLLWFAVLILLVGSAFLFGSPKPASADFADESVSDLAKYVRVTHGIYCVRGTASCERAIRMERSRLGLHRWRRLPLIVRVVLCALPVVICAVLIEMPVERHVIIRGRIFWMMEAESKTGAFLVVGPLPGALAARLRPVEGADVYCAFGDFSEGFPDREMLGKHRIEKSTSSGSGQFQVSRTVNAKSWLLIAVWVQVDGLEVFQEMVAVPSGSPDSYICIILPR